MRLKWKLFVASLKMISRQREAVLWSILLPLFMILLFSFVRFDGIGKVTLGVVDTAGGQAGTVLEKLKAIQTLSVIVGPRDEALDLLKKGERDLVLLLPATFSLTTPGVVKVYVNNAKPRESQLGLLVIQRVFDDLAFAHTAATERVVVVQETISGRNLTYFDFVAPGILAMSIMQLGIFGVAFGFVSLKKRGILRRLFVTPINPNDFIVAQVAMRLVLVGVQIVIMTLIPYVFLDLHFTGSFVNMFVVGVMGAIIFIALGFVVAGIGKSEDQVAPLANIIALPMMILSGIFFSRNSLPAFLRTMTDVFPLTFLADGMRRIALDGAALYDIGQQLAGLAVWCVVSIFLAVKMFRWE